MNRNFVIKLLVKGILRESFIGHVKIWGNEGSVPESLLHYKNATIYHYYDVDGEKHMTRISFKGTPLIVPIYIASVGI